jgi:hypothetical protein
VKMVFARVFSCGARVAPQRARPQGSARGSSLRSETVPARLCSLRKRILWLTLKSGISNKHASPAFSDIIVFSRETSMPPHMKLPCFVQHMKKAITQSTSRNTYCTSVRFSHTENRSGLISIGRLSDTACARVEDTSLRAGNFM